MTALVAGLGIAGIALGFAVPIRLEYLEKVRTALAEAEIEIPFPHLQLFIDGAKAFQRQEAATNPVGVPALALD